MGVIGREDLGKGTAEAIIAALGALTPMDADECSHLRELLLCVIQPAT